MALIALNGLDYGVGGPLLLESADLAIEAGERIALVGRNGAGKSTLLRLLAGELQPDDGQIRRQEGLRVTLMAQEAPAGLDGSVWDVVASGLGDAGALVARWHRASQAATPDVAVLGELQARIEAVGGWDLEQRVGQVLSQMDLDGEVAFDALSGGMKRRVLLARALAGRPDVLLLDEPTNHLDIEAIEWLEGFLSAFAGALVLVSHDRRFVRALATRIVEIDRGQVLSWPGGFDNFLRRRDERLHAEGQANARFDKMLAQEEVWIRQGIKARRTRDEGRVRRLEQMRRDAARRRAETGQVKLVASAAGESGKRVIEAEDVDFGYGGDLLVRGFSTRILRGDRIGLIGRNGSGKSTLLRLLLGELAPLRGEVRHGTRLEIAYFDQHRASLREDWNALDNVSQGREYIEVGGSRKHVLGYLQDFLFTPERARAPITRLSGGERNRLLLARLFAQPSNLLVMDEPTNDLDVETLELLEELLADYTGTLLLVSHDRDFLDKVVTSTLVMEGQGRVGEYVGGYSDWLRQRVAGGSSAALDDAGSGSGGPASVSATGSVPPGQNEAPASAAQARPRKLSYKDQRELEQLPARIEALEGRLAALGAAMADPAFYQRPAAQIGADQAALAATQLELDAAYARWAELDG
ncbi:MAG: ATP-binding cassette domain-containing protein [Xanthomonadales bacterium]|nr:ATP-binding cassette domain-containing protein [Xanthomonadales bacterium]